MIPDLYVGKMLCTHCMNHGDGKLEFVHCRGDGEE